MGLLSSMSDRHRYTILWSDPASGDFLKRNLGHLRHITFEKPLRSSRNFMLFAWQMLRLRNWLKRADADLLLSVNHHFPVGDIPQIIYHLNILRFDRPKRSLLAAGELADCLRDWRAAAALSNAQANIFESRFLMRLAESQQADIRDRHVIYIGRDDRRAPRQPRPVDYDENAILAITSAQPHKDNPTLIRMLAELVSRQPDADWRLKICGGTEQGAFTDLKRLGRDLGVAERLEWLGFVEHDRLAEIGSKSLCLVSASKVESFSMVSLEAMSWGCPPVVADTSAMPESVGDAGLLAQPGDAGDFARQVRRIRGERGLRDKLVKQGKFRLAGLGWSNAGKQFDVLLDRLLP